MKANQAMKPIANLIHVDDVAKALDWYQKAFASSRRCQWEGFEYLEIDGFALEFVLSDDKVKAGKSGSVTYWEVSDLDLEMQKFLALGSDIFRGPMAIGSGIGMCQMTDPFGNLIGLRGPYKLSG